MDDIEKLVKSLKKQGVFLKVNGDKLQIKVQNDKISSESHNALKKNKEEIIAYLKCKYAPLSFGQERLWFLAQYNHNNSYNMPIAIRMHGTLYKRAFEKALFDILRRHEILRTNFKILNNEPRQVVNSIEDFAAYKNSKYRLEIIELNHLPKEEADKQILKLIENASREPFDLENDCLIKTILFTIDNKESVLFMNKHHIVSDGWSFSILIREISVLYEAYKEGLSSPLEKLPIQYADYSIWQREHLKGEVLNKQSEYWKNKLSGAEILELPTDRPRPAEQTFNGAKLSFKISKELSEELNVFSKKNDVTLFMTLLSAFKVLLNRYTGQDDICVGSPIANRTRSEIEPLIGFFVNTLALRSDLSGDISFLDLIKQVKQTTLDAYDNQEIPFEKVVDIVQPKRNLSYSPLFQVMIALQNNPTSKLPPGDLHLSAVKFESNVSIFDLTINFTETTNGIFGGIEYNTDLFDKTRIERMVGHFSILVESIISKATVNISELEIVTPVEKHQLLVEGNDIETYYPKDRCVHQLFEEQVETIPGNIAAVFEGEELSYDELNEKANKLAHYLQSKGIKPESLVGICVDRSLDMIVGLLGILKAGGAYVPIDPTYPKERISYMLNDSGCEIVLSQEHIKLPETSSEIIYLDRDWNKIGNESAENVKSDVKGDNLAYIIYTSGSTGKPKGVMIEHLSLCNYVFWAKEKYLGKDKLNFPLFTSPSFDLTITSIFTPLISGNSLIIYPNEDAELAIFKVISDLRVGAVKLTPAHLNMIKEEVICDSIKCMIVGGDNLMSDLASAVSEKDSNLINIYNEYGPTEATVGCMIYNYDSTKPINKSVPIGVPSANNKIYILDKNLGLSPIGVTGELHIAGDGLARGYLKRPELTAEKFIKNPFSDDPNSRLYKTGDLVRYLEDGNIEFIGRVDNQVKIRGFRIELGEIEANINRIKKIKDSIVVVKDDTNGYKQLVAYVVSDNEINVPKIKEDLSRSLPDYMIPSLFVGLDEIPLTPNGKIDKVSLPVAEIEIVKDYVAPSNELEKKLVEIWATILNMDKELISTNCSFFDVGGNSLKIVQLSSVINETFNWEISIPDLFRYSSISSLVGYVNSKKDDKEAYEKEAEHEVSGLHNLISELNYDEQI